MSKKKLPNLSPRPLSPKVHKLAKTKRAKVGPSEQVFLEAPKDIGVAPRMRGSRVAAQGTLPVPGGTIAPTPEVDTDV